MTKILADVHCHTIASDHAYSTVLEMAKAAAEAGLEAIAITDHAPELGDGPHWWHFDNLKIIPHEIYGVKILRGIEMNILNSRGEVDRIPRSTMSRLDIVIASIHSPCYGSEGLEDHTSSYMGALQNPFVDIIGHSGTAAYPYDHMTVAKKAKELGKLIEINQHSFVGRASSIPNCKKIAEACKAAGTGIVVNSDAHITFDLGDYSDALALLKSIDFPEELIINRSYRTLKEFLRQRKIIGE